MSVKRKRFENGLFVNIPQFLPAKLQKEFHNKLGAAGKRWANKEVKTQATELHSMLVEEMLDTSRHPYLTGNMASHWEIGYVGSYAKYGAQISLLQTAVNKSGLPYAQYEEALHHPLATVLQNRFFPTVMTRLRARFKRDFAKELK